MDEISLRAMFHTLKKRWILIVLIPLIASLVSGAISIFLLTPIYQASTQLLVNQKDTQNQLDANLLRSNVDLINTYSDIIKSPVILDKVIDKLSLSQSVEELNSNISINSQANSQVFSIFVEDVNPRKAVEIANTVSETFQQNVTGIMNVDNVSILAKAKLNENPTPLKPQHVLNVTIALVIGLMISFGIIFLMEYLDNTFKNSHDIESYLGLPVLGSIPEVSHKKSSKAKALGGEALESKIEA
ncbi:MULTISPECIES: YveK family protein [Bacillaceae]|uniref:YveK family protein n=1 Tax=Bacillaceae TaxID=186817 RepID=UPI000BFDCCE8|nr:MULTISPECIES: Wzz/FepE/Etk N-terminal domain-containing protein [Bacillaceae]PGT79460.1 capsular biosynthesis protein [Bacillus sp. AFS040349]UGB29495.1 Wzz/FepE/Etk N-terminal domain-containing protein [Metabacillus sp. B2-18]